MKFAFVVVAALATCFGVAACGAVEECEATSCNSGSKKYQSCGTLGSTEVTCKYDGGSCKVTEANLSNASDPCIEALSTWCND